MYPSYAVCLNVAESVRRAADVRSFVQERYAVVDIYLEEELASNVFFVCAFPT